MKSKSRFSISCMPGALALASLLVLCGASRIGCQSFDWPRWRGPEGNGISSESNWNPKALSDGPRVLWKADVGQGHSSMVIKENRLFIMGMKAGENAVSCLEADSGKPVWQYSFESYEEPLATPVVNKDSVYALSKEGILLCLSAQDGKLLWKKDLVGECGAVRPSYGFSGSPVVAGDLLILTVNTAGMTLNARTGNLAWSSVPPPSKIKAYDTQESRGTDYSTPVVYEQDGKHYALIASWTGISSVESTTGRPNWIYAWELYSGRHITDPAVSGNRIYVADNYAARDSPASMLLKFDAKGPTVIWKSPDLTTEITNAVILDGFIYGGQGGPYRYSASLRCINLETGKLIWDKTMSEEPLKGCVSLMAAGGKLIVLTDDGVLAVAEASSQGYKEISRCALPWEKSKYFMRFWTPPVLCNGRIYCRNFFNDLVCIDVSK